MDGKPIRVVVFVLDDVRVVERLAIYGEPSWKGVVLTADSLAMHHHLDFEFAFAAGRTETIGVKGSKEGCSCIGSDVIDELRGSRPGYAR
jgi:hypothetical protein